LKPLSHWLRMIAQRLDEIDVGYALVGALAVGVRTEPRFTRDIDLAVSVASDAEAEKAAGHLIRYGFRLVEEFDHDKTGRLVTGRFAPPGIDLSMIEGNKPVVADLLFMTSGIEPEIVASATAFEIIPGLVIPVAQTAHLIAMKLLSVSKHRPRDTDDLQQLILGATADELKHAHQLAGLIMERKSEIRRDLHAALDRYIKRWKK